LKYFKVWPADPTLSAWVFYQDDSRGRLVCRDLYKGARCQTCGKVFVEEALLKNGISPDFKVRTKRDWAGTWDSMIVCSQRFRETVESAGVTGLLFHAIPSVSDHFVAICDHLVRTDESRAGFEDHDICTACNRYKERLVGPFTSAMDVRVNSLTFFASTFTNENSFSSFRVIFVGSEVVQILKEAKLKGLEFVLDRSST
jgi:hypothetical protein